MSACAGHPPEAHRVPSTTRPRPDRPGDRRGFAVRRRHHTRPARAGPAWRHPDRPRDPGLADRAGRQGLHRPGGRGAAAPGRRPGCRRAHADPLRRPQDHRRAAGPAGPARGRRGDRADRAADLPSGARPCDPDPQPVDVRVAVAVTQPDRCGRRAGAARRGRSGHPARRPRPDRRGRRRRRGRTRPAGPRRLVRHHRLQGLRRAVLDGAHRHRCLRPAERPGSSGRHRARRPGHLLPAGRPVGAVRRRHPRRLDADHRRLHRSRRPRSWRC